MILIRILIKIFLIHKFYGHNIGEMFLDKGGHNSIFYTLHMYNN